MAYIKNIVMVIVASKVSLRSHSHRKYGIIRAMRVSSA